MDSFTMLGDTIASHLELGVTHSLTHMRFTILAMFFSSGNGPFSPGNSSKLEDPSVPRETPKMAFSRFYMKISVGVKVPFLEQQSSVKDCSIF